MSGAGSSDSERPRTPRRMLVVLLGLQLLIGAALLTWVAIGRPVPGVTDAEPSAQAAPSSAPSVDRFNGKRAFALLRRQVEVYGPRPAGSKASRRLGNELVRLMPNARFERVPGGLRNIVAEIPGTGPHLVVGAHYDTEATVKGHVGANDGAAGTAAVVELARTMSRMQRPATAPPIRFVLFDGEEEPRGTKPTDNFEDVGLRGSKVEAAKDPLPQAMILLDYIAERKGLSFPREANSDPAIWARLRAAAQRVGTSKYFPDATTYGVIDDHVPFIRRGVPSIDLIDFEYPERDSVRDNMRAVSERSLDITGETVLELLRTW